MLITVIDQTNAVIPDATVTVIGAEPATQKTDIPPVQTTQNGLATVTGLTPGRYTARAEFQGFYPGRAQRSARPPGRQPSHHRAARRELRGDRRGEAGRAGRRGRSAQRCVRLGADARADGCALGRSRRDAAAVDGHGRAPAPSSASTASKAGGCRRSRRSSRSASRAISSPRRITVPTRSSSRSSRSPASAPVRTGMRYGFRNSAMSARNAFTPTKGEEQDQQYGFNTGGGLIQNKASFFISVNGNSAYDTPNSSIARSTGTQLRDAQAPRAARVQVRSTAISTGPRRAIRRCGSASTAATS